MSKQVVGRFASDGTWMVDLGSSDSTLPVLLLHGVGLDHRMWDVQADALAVDRRVLRYDLIGHGDTSPRDGELTLYDFRDQVSAVLGAAAVDKVLLVGFSLGGIIAQRFAADFPERVAGLVLVSTVYCRTSVERAGVLERLALTERDGIGAIVQPALDRWFAPEFARSRRAQVAAVAERLATTDPDGYLAAYRIFATGDKTNGRVLRGVDCPALVVTGSEDVGSTPAIAERMAADLKRADLILLDGLRHMVTLEAADEVSGLLRAFAARIDQLI